MSGVLTLRRCLLLCLPALAIGVWLRATVLLATPEAILTADTNSYWDCVSRLWNDGKFEIPEKRRWLYPLVLMLAPALPGNTPQAVALGQYTLGVLAIVGVGWIAGHLTRWREIVVPLSTVLFAVSPRGLAYEHQMIADSLMTNLFILAAAAAIPLRGLTQRRLGWTIALCALVVALKPHGKPLALPILVAAACAAGVPWRWHRANWLLGALCLGLFVSSGSSHQGGWLLLGSTLPLVPETGEPFANYRAALAPVIHEARALGDAYPWYQFRYKKLLSDSDAYDDLAAGQTFAKAGPEWNPLTKRKEEFGRVTSALARSGIRAAPLTALRFTATKIARGLAASEFDQLEILSPAAFWESQRARNDERWTERPKAITLMYELDRPAFDAFVRERSARRNSDVTANPLVRLAAGVRWFGDDTAAHRVWWTWIGILGALGVAAAARSREGIALTGALALSLATSYGIGDAVARYVYPVEWMSYVFSALGLAALADIGLLLKRKSSPSPVHES